MKIDLQQIQEVFNRTFENCPIINIDSSPSTIEQWDSMGHLNLILEIEEMYNIKLEMDDVIQMTSVNKIIEIFNKY